MMIRASLTVLCVVALGVVAACESETGPDAPKRENGCIDTDCVPVSSSGNTTSSGGATDAGSDAS